MVDQANAGIWLETLDMKSIVLEVCNNAATSRCSVYTDLLGHYKIFNVVEPDESSLHVCESYWIFDLYIQLLQAYFIPVYCFSHSSDIRQHEVI